MSDPMDVFLKSLVPPAYDREEVALRRDTLSTVLNKHSLNAGYFVESGSFAHGTGIAQKSDVDYIAWATPASGRPQLPSSALTSLKSALTGADWKISSLSVSSPVVQVKYISAPHFEIVPAFSSREAGGVRVWSIPGRGDEWVDSAPAAHKAYVNAANDRLGKKVKSLVRFAKAWKYHVGAPVSSFYLEMRVAQYANTQTSIDFYDLDLRYAMHSMINFELCDMTDPLGTVGRIPACSSDVNRRTTLRMMNEAVVNLAAAYEGEKQHDASAYWMAMYRVFGSDFPWPGW